MRVSRSPRESPRAQPLIGRFRYIASRAERLRFDRNSVRAFNLAPAFPRGALTLCPQLCMGISSRRYTEIGLFVY